MPLLYYAVLACSLCVSVSGYLDFKFPCITPNQEEAYCVSIFSCPTLMQAMGTLQRSSIDFVKKSVCWGWTYNDMKVCCGTTSNYVYYREPPPTTTQHPFTFSKFPAFSTLLPTTTTKRPSTKRQPTLTTSITTQSTTTHVSGVTKLASEREEKKKLLPSRRICGFQHTDDRPYANSATALDEFPWMVHVVFIEDDEEDSEQYLDRCNGVLISKRYVLTSDYCALYAPKVRLGQYNTNKTETCIDDPELPECSDPWLDVEVEEEIHRLNIEIPRTKIVYDLALLRLKEIVSFTDFIRPICLPLDETIRPTADQSFYYSGWGSLNPTMIEKKRLTYNLTSNEECYSVDNELKVDSTNVSLMCLKPKHENGALACTGDEAGPLLYSHRHQWFVEGVIMKVYHDGGDSAQRCSNTHPISAVRITSEIVNWILDSIKE